MTQNKSSSCGECGSVEHRTALHNWGAPTDREHIAYLLPDGKEVCRPCMESPEAPYGNPYLFTRISWAESRCACVHGSRCALCGEQIVPARLHSDSECHSECHSDHCDYLVSGIGHIAEDDPRQDLWGTEIDRLNAQVESATAQWDITELNVGTATKERVMTHDEDEVLAEAMSVVQEQQEVIKTENDPRSVGVEIVRGDVLNATLWEHPDSEWVPASDYVTLAEAYNTMISQDAKANRNYAAILKAINELNVNKPTSMNMLYRLLNERLEKW